MERQRRLVLATPVTASVRAKAALRQTPEVVAALLVILEEAQPAMDTPEQALSRPLRSPMAVPGAQLASLVHRVVVVVAEHRVVVVVVVKPAVVAAVVVVPLWSVAKPQPPMRTAPAQPPVALAILITPLPPVKAAWVRAVPAMGWWC